MDINTVFSGVELDDDELLDFVFDEEEEEEGAERSLMEHLIYGCYDEVDDDGESVVRMQYEADEWLNLWRQYVELDRENNVIWKFSDYISSWEELELILENLEIIQEEDAALFEELFTSNFVSCLLYEIGIAATVKSIVFNEKKIKTLAKWIQKHKSRPFSQNDFWRVLYWRGENGFSSRKEGIEISDLDVEYSRLWRVCCLRPILISFKEERQRKTFAPFLDIELNEGQYLPYLDREQVDRLLDLTDGVVDNKDHVYSKMVEWVLVRNDKELLYRCLKKNFFTPTK